jgi:hypothetical protein
MALLVLVLAGLPALVAAAGGWVGISTVAGGENGTVIVSGTTNLAPGNILLIEIVSSSFTPTNKSQAEYFSGASGTVKVEEGSPYNLWTFTVDTPLRPDTYLMTVTHIESGTEASGAFTLTGETVSEVTTAAMTAESTATTTIPETAPAQMPASLAAAVLGIAAGAFLVRRH